MARRALTIIEMLVVIAVIAVVVALVLPCLGAIRSEAAKLNCVARLSQCAKAVHAYANEMQDHVPQVPPDEEAGQDPQDIRASLFCGERKWIEAAYFGQARMWSSVLAVHAGRALDELTCPSIRPGDELDPLLWGSSQRFRLCSFSVFDSSYALSKSFLANGSSWREDRVQTRADLRLQPLSSVAFASQKALFFEAVVFHRSGYGERPADRSPASAPVAFVDGSCGVRDFAQATSPIATTFQPTAQALHGTREGVLGRDFE